MGERALAQKRAEVADDPLIHDRQRDAKHNRQRQNEEAAHVGIVRLKEQAKARALRARPALQRQVGQQKIADTGADQNAPGENERVAQPEPQPDRNQNGDDVINRARPARPCQSAGRC